MAVTIVERATTAKEIAMWFRSRVDGLSVRSSPTPARPTKRAVKGRERPRSVRPRLESLEDRSVLSTYTVNSLTDTGAGSGPAGDLRYCVTHATSGTDTITFGVTGTIRLARGLPALNMSVAIQGPGADRLAVERDPASRSAFAILSVGYAARVQMSGLTIAKGADGSVRNYGTLTISDSVLSDNSARDPGGAVRNYGTLTISDSVLSGNSAPNCGGAIYNAGTLTISNSTLANNTTFGDVVYYWDAPYYPYYAIVGSDAFGGAVYVASGTAYIDHCTLASNEAVGGNGAPGDPGNYPGEGYGGDIANAAGSSALRLSNTIVASLYGNLTSLGHNLVRYGANPGDLAPSDLNSVDPRLGSLRNNGGPTPTMAILPDSPAINAGGNTAGLATDQRGYPRVAGPAADIGAYEYQPLRLSGVRVNDGSAQRSMVTSVTVTFNTFAVLPPNLASAFSLSGPDGAITLTVDLLQSTSTESVARLTFNGPGVVAGSLPDGRYTLRVLATQVTDRFCQPLDGDDDGQPGGDYVSTNAAGMFRLFGDISGDGTVNGLDLAGFRSAFGSTVGDLNFRNYLDFNGGGVINGVDLAEFRTRFGVNIP